MVRKAEKNDISVIADLAVLLWSGHLAGDLRNEFTEILSKDSSQIFLKYENDIPVGFAQCQLRNDYV